MIQIDMEMQRLKEVDMMLKAEVEEFSRLSGEDGAHTSISRIGAFLDGYHTAMRQQWIPVKWKQLNDLEREEWEDAVGYKLTDEEAVEADCTMPNDGDEIWICTKSGQVCDDIFCNDYGLLSLEDGDIMDVVAWMPRITPEPYKGESNGQER